MYIVFKPKRNQFLLGESKQLKVFVLCMLMESLSVFWLCVFSYMEAFQITMLLGIGHQLNQVRLQCST